MFGLSLGLVLRIGAALALAAACYAAWYGVEHWCNAACRAETQRADGIKAAWDADIARRVALTTAITLEWDKQRQIADALEAKHEQIRNVLFASAEAAARALPKPVASVVVPGAAVGVLNAAVDASNTTAAGPAREPPTPPTAATADSSLGLVVEWGVTCAKYYAAAVDQVVGWQKFYAGLRLAEEKLAP